MLSRTPLLFACLIPALSVSAQDSQTDNEKISKILGHYNQMMKEDDWDSAKVLAFGARAKFSDGENHLFSIMIHKAQAAKRFAENTKRLQDSDYQFKNAYDSSARAYVSHEIPTMFRLRDNADASELTTHLKSKLGDEAMRDVRIVYNNANDLIITASATMHAKISALLKSQDRAVNK